MTVHRFYIREPLAPNGTSCLGDAQTHQARRVLRLREGDEIAVFDGSGHEYTATLGTPDRKSWQFRTGERLEPRREPEFRLTVGLSILRNERFDMAVQKLTELGVAGIVPLAAERSMISYDDARAWEKRRARLERITIEAAEQSERTTLPTLHEPLLITEYFERRQEADIIALVERNASTGIATIHPTSPATLLVGPEGGWTDDELTAMADHGATMASMGRLILRAETAAIVGAGCILLSSTPEGGITS